MKMIQFTVSYSGHSGGRTSITMVAINKEEVLRAAKKRFPLGKDFKAVFVRNIDA